VDPELAPPVDGALPPAQGVADPPTTPATPAAFGPPAM
jgi:hypothetical protein